MKNDREIDYGEVILDAGWKRTWRLGLVVIE